MSEKGKFPLIIAHRGASATAPENTLAAFEQAVKVGAEGLEFDVRLTKNGVPVVFHDPTLKRIAGSSDKVIDLTSDQLAAIDSGSWFNARHPPHARPDFQNARISTLSQTLDFLRNFKGLFYVELKCAQNEVAPLTAAVADIIQESKLFPQIIVKSFETAALEQIKNIIPQIRTAALFAPKIAGMLRRQNHLIEKAQECRADEISLHFSLATQKLVEKAAENNLPAIIWTADHPVWLKRGREIGIKAIITNNPRRLLTARRQIADKL